MEDARQSRTDTSELGAAAGGGGPLDWSDHQESVLSGHRPSVSPYHAWNPAH